MEKSAVKGQAKGVINSRQIKVILYTNIFSSHFLWMFNSLWPCYISHFRLSTTTLGIIRGLCQGWLFLDSLDCELHQHTYQCFSLSFMWRHFSVLPLLNRSEIFITRIILSNCVCTWIRGNCQSRHHIWKGREETVEKWRGLCLSFLKSNQLDIRQLILETDQPGVCFLTTWFLHLCLCYLLGLSTTVVFVFYIFIVIKSLFRVMCYIYNIRVIVHAILPNDALWKHHNILLLEECMLIWFCRYPSYLCNRISWPMQSWVW
jgi:hypothetical protein